MSKAKKLFLLHERRETWRLRISSPKQQGRCGQCGKEVEWLPAAAAALVLGITEREIFRLAERGSIHFAESEAGSMLVCIGSLERGEEQWPEIPTRGSSTGSGNE